MMGKKSKINLRRLFYGFVDFFSPYNRSKDVVCNTSSAEEVVVSEDSSKYDIGVQEELLINWNTLGESKSGGKDRIGVSWEKISINGNEEVPQTVERAVDSLENFPEEVKDDEKLKIWRNANGESERSRNSGNLFNGKHSDDNLPASYQFRTAEGFYFCHVCSWSSSTNAFESFLDHCKTKEHRERLKNRFPREREKLEIEMREKRKLLSELKIEPYDSNGSSQIGSTTKKDGGNSVVKTIQLQEQKKSHVTASVTETTKKSEILNSGSVPFKVEGSKKVKKKKRAKNKQIRTEEESSGKDKVVTPKLKDLLQETLLAQREMTGRKPEDFLRSFSEGRGSSENKIGSDKRLKETNPKVNNFKKVLLDVVNHEKVQTQTETSNGAKKTDVKKKNSESKKEGVSKTNQNGSSSELTESELQKMAEMKKSLLDIGITFFEPVSVSLLNCKVCDKFVPASSNFDATMENIGMHVQGKSHLSKLAKIQEITNAVIFSLKNNGKSLNESLHSLNRT